MREDFPNGRVTSRSLKSTVFASHDGEWEVSGTCTLRWSSSPVNVLCVCAVLFVPCDVIILHLYLHSNTAALLVHPPPADYVCASSQQKNHCPAVCEKGVAVCVMLQVLPRASGGCHISHVATSKLKGRLPPGLGACSSYCTC